jgi:hypothetical protein
MEGKRRKPICLLAFAVAVVLISLGFAFFAFKLDGRNVSEHSTAMDGNTTKPYADNFLSDATDFVSKTTKQATTEMETTSTTTTQDPCVARRGKEFRGICYKVYWSYITWESAILECQRRDAQLATITDADQMDFILSLRHGWVDVKMAGGVWRNRDDVDVTRLLQGHWKKHSGPFVLVSRAEFMDYPGTFKYHFICSFA